MAVLIFEPTVGATYQFKFISGFESFNGIYTVSKVMTYAEYVDDGGDIEEDFFAPVGKEDELAQNTDQVRSSKILKLISPDENSDNDPLYAPMVYLAETPDFNVKKYYNIGVIAKIGVVEEAETVDFIKDTITQTVEAALGITPDPKLVITGSKWLTKTEYQEILASRDKEKQKVLNYYSENLRLEKVLMAAQTRIKEYEALIINQQQHITTLRKEIEDLKAQIPSTGE